MVKITLLDGGMGQELVHRAGDKPTPLWSTQVMMEHPGLVQAVHEDYYNAGSVVATTNTYAIHRDRLVKAGIEDKFEALYALALQEAKAAQASCGGIIAGSIGPLGASYRADVHPGFDIATPLYAEIAKLMAPSVDVLACETVVSADAAKAALAGALQADKPVWLAVSVDDEDGTLLRSGEKLADILPIARDGAAALLVNCSAPEIIPQALEVIAQADLPMGAYGNGFTQITKEFLKDSPTVDALSARRDMGPEIYADHVMRWVEMGATIVGGCCETGPAHIAEIAKRLRAAGHDIA
ncbi:MAG: homocysteine S-methyltransferase family protein [Pelagimonas sp.]|jgi:homocysteine S-methyltransferase|nr:homocysteine S-methyltransferase family protein [Pelagimonas sp.]